MTVNTLITFLLGMMNEVVQENDAHTDDPHGFCAYHFHFHIIFILLQHYY